MYHNNIKARKHGTLNTYIANEIRLTNIKSEYPENGNPKIFANDQLHEGMKRKSQQYDQVFNLSQENELER